MKNHDKNLACIILKLVVIGYIPMKTTVYKETILDKLFWTQF